VQDLYTENYKISLMEIKWEEIHVHGVEDLRLKISILYKLIYKFNEIPIRIPGLFACFWQRLTS
jgi:hypothetical protein